VEATEPSAWSFMKWILLVLAAGFIGQFGRAMAEGILARARRLFGWKKKEKSPLTEVPSREGPAGPEPPPPPSPEKSAKKALKAQLKMAKKAAKVKK